MFSSPLQPGGGNLTLIFGSQALDFNEETAAQLRGALLRSPSLEWICEVIADLRHHWKYASNAVPELVGFPGDKLLDGLNQWLRRGKFPDGTFPLPNILLTPLVVITQLTQYLAVRKLCGSSSSLSADFNSTYPNISDTLGLCTGLLSAAAISSAANDTQFQRFGAVAVRLAMIIGAMVDAQDAVEDSQGKWASFSVAWTSAELDDAITKILPDFPGAYVSVVSDERRITVTSPKKSAALLQQRFKEVGANTTALSLRGSFHRKENHSAAESIITFCDGASEFQFPDSSELIFPVRSNTGGQYIQSGALHRTLVQSILTEQSDWQQAFTALHSMLTPDARIVSFGLERCVPSSLLRKLGPHLIQITDLDLEQDRLLGMLLSIGLRLQEKEPLYDDAIAVVGMSCHLPGAADLEDFWDILCAGRSQHIEVPADRFQVRTVWRDLDLKRKWYGNFIQDYDTFDHKFFKKSPREMASTDPQHRLMLQAAYQAVEQSGYFNSPFPDQHIGCYIGVGLTDYENNIACHPANAYSATGNLKAFTAGKISHHFGWTGPGLTIDTACSTSAVAINQACKGLLTGECSAALVGGVNIMTSPEWFQNLAGASFLSPSGQCKPFDADADGYCRAEGVGAVFLKKLSVAVKEGNQILGVIASSAVYQNQNCTAITVPNVPSLSDLFSDVTRRAGLQPRQISVVEAHGTGTPVGDPVEYDSVRKVFGGSIRSDILSLSSVKGLLGHTESASGMVALIKTLLMIIKGAIPPQASFKTINPSIHASPFDNIEIPTKLKRWDVDFRAALINNYGASGSNASLVVTQGPSFRPPNNDQVLEKMPISKYPFWLCGFDENSLRSYSAKLLQFLESRSQSDVEPTISDLSFQVSHQSNRNLGQSLVFNCTTIPELKAKLASFASSENKPLTTTRQGSSRPVVLCFGGQISTFVGLDRGVYDSVMILRKHLDQCDEVCRFLGLDSIYPDIFQREPLTDTVKLQTALFAVQYSCAQSWISCGVKPTALIGHSFGELTAMCVSGILSLKDALRLVAGRARIIRDSWGPERGAMMAVEADLELVQSLLADSSHRNSKKHTATIACFNGPRSFTLAGSPESIESVRETAITIKSFSSVKMKNLDVTHAFHSTLVESILPQLEKLGEEITLRDPVIPLERAVFDDETSDLDSKFVASHLRNPVYFDHAVRRLSQKYSGCIWLEAGSNSTITSMASRALGSPKSSHFQPVNITSNDAFRFLTEATTNLWKEGLAHSFWAHHAVQNSFYSLVLLPPYQFERSKHWMELKSPENLIGKPATPSTIPEFPRTIWTFVGYQDKQERMARFRINTMTEQYQNYVSAHVIVQTAPICPSTYQLVIAIDALASLAGDSKSVHLKPELQGMVNHAPMCMDQSKFFWLSAERHADNHIWDWKITSDTGETAKVNETVHVTGRIVFKNKDDLTYQKDFSRYERLVRRLRCLAMLDGSEADGVIQGSRNIYRAFSDIVQYKHDLYKGLHKIAGRDCESAGRIMKGSNGDTWLDLGLADAYCQVAGIFLNTMTDKPDGDMYVSDRIDQWIRSPKMSNESLPQVWEVLACHSRPSDQECTSDVFVFDASSGELVEVILGIHYLRVSRLGMAKLLSRLSPESSKVPQLAPLSVPTEIPIINGIHSVPAQENPGSKPHTSIPKKEKKSKGNSGSNISGPVRHLLCNLSGLEPDEIKDDAKLVDLGIDSLMGMELATEIENMFKCTLDASDLLELTDFRSLIACIQNTLGLTDSLMDDEEGEEKRENETNGVVHEVQPQTNGFISPPAEDTIIPASVILGAFDNTKQETDRFIEDNKLANYVDHVLPKSNELCVVHILDGFEQLGCSLRDAEPGQLLNRIEYLPRHEQFVEFIYNLLEEADLIQLDGSRIVRTATPAPTKSAAKLLQELISENSDHAFDYRLTYLTGAKLADCLIGKEDGLQLIFASAEGREIVSGMYGKSPINVAWIKQMQYLLKEFFHRLPPQNGPIKILEMGAGTGGTTANLVPVLASLNIPFQYTVTDLSPSLVAAARKRFKGYSFMEYRVLDIEKEPPAELFHSQHIIIATNCVHATHSLVQSTKNIHQVLRADGFLMMLEMTQTIPWIDLVFGLLEGWWLFDDGRRHALVSPTVWENTMRSVGYGHIDWTDGSRPEAAIQRIIIGLASSQAQVRVHEPLRSLGNPVTDTGDRQAVVDAFVENYTRDFIGPAMAHICNGTSDVSRCVLVTGATGSLGSHLVAYFAALPNVNKVICMNRYSSIDCTNRQLKALESRGLFLSPEALSKLKVLEADASKAALGLPSIEYIKLTQSVTDIVHNAWPMSITRSVNAFEPQFKAMRNLLDLARECVSLRPQNTKFGFQFISSIATIGYYPLWSGQPLVPEKPMSVKSVLPNGYGDAKLVCERMLDETLQQYLGSFRPMAVRIGQIAGSKTSGYWNPVEHLAFMIKSSQTLLALPDFSGELSWCPVNDVAATLGELLLNEGPTHSIYHIENPARQPWREMIQVLAEGLDIPPDSIIPFAEWLRRVREFPGSADENPAKGLVEFLEIHYERMSCGGLIMDTTNSREHSRTLRDAQPVGRDLVMKYIDGWKDMGFLQA